MILNILKFISNKLKKIIELQNNSELDKTMILIKSHYLLYFYKIYIQTIYQ